ncbi:hypothetical protein PP175_26180 (plasmid) [Aneurinibacillus sp. Ricciae_BoGa-3]|uniref:hypothetical protein n=1 Tax=Aneurinibacillus sp. Ricciae_BoGa-3 TaxID=3022697 RepID=UPI00234268B8|nr:hypothetical protein [Aneurinibacillus sp. Ricciae_BoGa-3]WCK57556.1 hypothetical protein PP175_26180 [Aneurinibacillus sp. Ricciae_BoGa-3]
MQIFKFKGTIVKAQQGWYVAEENGKTQEAGDLLTGIDSLSNFLTQEGDKIEIIVKRRKTDK